jgi:hypothetical protein
MNAPSERARVVLERYRTAGALGASEKTRLGDVIHERVLRGDLPRFDIPAALVVVHQASLAQRLWGSALGKLGAGLVLVGASSAVVYELKAPPSQLELQAPAATVAHLPPAPHEALKAAPDVTPPKPELVEDQAAPAAMPPHPKPDRVSATPSASEPTIDEEVKLMNAAQSALRAGDSKHALELLNEHAARFPSGKLATARQVTHMMALCQAGKSGQARQEAASFLAKNPSSPFATRVSGICASNK